VTLGYSNPLVKWAYLFRKGVPNETTIKDFFYLALVLVPGCVILGATGLGLLGLFLWKHPWAAVWLPYVLWGIGSLVYVFTKFSQSEDVKVFGCVPESDKVYFE